MSLSLENGSNFRAVLGMNEFLNMNTNDIHLCEDEEEGGRGREERERERERERGRESESYGWSECVSVCVS